jgi:hypothetical protein
MSSNKVTDVYFVLLTDHSMVFNQPELEKWPETDNETANGCKEVLGLRKRLFLCHAYLNISV